MRIGFFSDSYFPEVDGVTYTLKTWKERLEERGHEIYIVYPGSPEYEPSGDEIPVRSVPNPFYSGYRIPVPGSIDFPEVDVVHCHSPATIGLTGRFFAWKTGKPVVYTHHTPLEEYFVQAVKSDIIAGLLAKLYVPLENLYLKTFDVLTASTQEVNRSPEHVQLPVGLDLEFFQPTSSSTLDELDAERPVAGYSGRISNEKNPRQLLRLAEEFPGTVVIVGDGPLKDDMVEEAPGNVVFMDWLDREELPGFYSALDVFVTASSGDTLGLSPLEANACGTPVVAADRFPFNETIGDGQGYTFRPGDVEDFAAKTVKAARESFDTRAAVEDYSMEKTIDRLEEIYGDLYGD